MQTIMKSPGLLGPYLRTRRISAARQFLTGRVLDVGCNHGPLCDFVPADRYVGVDIRPEAIAQARRNHPAHCFMGVDDIDVDERFDTVAALAVIEHVSEPEAWLRRWSAHVRPGGHVVLTTPHARWEPLVGLTSKVKLTNVGTDHGHETAFDRRSLHATVEAAGLRPTLYRTFLGGMNQLLVAER